MYMPALSCIHHDNYFASFYLHLLEQIKPKKVAIVAIMQKNDFNSYGSFEKSRTFCPRMVKESAG